MFISEEIRNFVRDTFFFGGMVEVIVSANTSDKNWYENGNYVSKKVEDYKLSDEWMGDENIAWLEENGVIYREDDDYYHIEEVFIDQFFTDKERMEEIAMYNAKLGK